MLLRKLRVQAAFTAVSPIVQEFLVLPAVLGTSYSFGEGLLPMEE